MQVSPDLTLFPVNWKNADSCSYNQQNYIHVFKLNLDNLGQFTESLVSFLSLEEKEKANRYSNIKDKNASIIRWAVTRLLIAKYSVNLPETLCFSRGKYGKPQLVQDNSSPSLFFNLSISGNYALIAVSNRETGVDIEQVKPGFNFRELLDFVFSSEEKKSILNSTDPLTAFYCFFTRKEAIVKALGTGIHDQLPGLPVLGPASSQTIEYQKELASLQLISFKVTQNHIASLAFNTDIENLLFYEADEQWLATEIQ
jgi:4'-phosphopantetheinyl transferase